MRERFDEKWELDNVRGCWIWTGARDSGGYGHLWVPARKKLVAAHRVGFDLYGGVIPERLDLDHLCRNPGCVNPQHLEAVTRQENLRRSTETNVGKTHCKRGHEFTPANTRIRKNDGGRECRACDREKYRRRKALA